MAGYGRGDNFNSYLGWLFMILALLFSIAIFGCESHEEVEIWTVVAKRENPNKGSWILGSEYEIAFDNGETRACEWGLYLSIDSADRFEVTKIMGNVTKVIKIENK